MDRTFIIVFMVISNVVTSRAVVTVVVIIATIEVVIAVERRNLFADSCLIVESKLNLSHNLFECSK